MQNKNVVKHQFTSAASFPGELLIVEFNMYHKSAICQTNNYKNE